MPNIKTYCRIKPTTETYPDYEVTIDTLHLRVPEVIRDVNTVNKSHNTINHAFHFDYIFSIDTSQEEVFDKAAVDIVQGFLLGYNGTIFAYGQTGTGKTYTVEGSAKTYSQRGLEPRALSMIYQALEKRQDEEIQVHISYMEIYQEVGYDLLNPGARTQSCVTHFPKVTVLEGPSGSWVIRNLSIHLAASEEVAQSLLLQGEANRKVAATTVHDRSSRSHAVFTIQLIAKKPDSDTFVRSKLHLVDLAGSERVSKTGVYGQQLSEAKSINLSLHHLESVIVALQQETINNDSKLPGLRSSYANRSHSYLLQRPTSADGYRTSKHIPYRNSVLTMVLRDSLGGNCLTAMIATISLEFENLGETISTCRFAGRVACIANSVSRNEQLDEKTLIRKLRKRVAELESELNCLKMDKEQSGEVAEGAVSRLSHAEKRHCAQVIQDYMSGQITDPVLAGITDPYKFRECLRILRKLVINGYFGSPATDPNNNAFSSADQSQPDQSVLNQSEPDSSAFRQEQHDIGLDESILSKSMQKTKHERSESHRPRASQRLQTETSSYAQNKSRQAWWDQPETKDPETLSEMLNASSRPEKYKSPFEKKRVKDIRRLNKKLAKMKAENEQQKKEVTDVKVSLAEQELDLMERSIRTKLDVTRAQVKDQQAFMQQLRVTEADPEILEQEKLVERQLMKRQMKFEKKLEDAGKRLAQLRNHVVAQSENETKKEVSLEEKFGQFKKRDGSLNTRQVFDMLKNEERKQTKTQAQIDHEKLFMTSRHLEVKEAATRQRLQEFKDMMRQSQIGYPVIINDEPVNDVPEHDLTDKKVPRKGDNTLQFMNGYGIGERDHEINITFVKEKAPPDGSEFIPEMNGIIANGCPENEKRPSSSFSVRSTRSNIPSSEFYAKRKKEKDPDSRWESYSRPGTSGGNRAGPQPHQEASKSISMEDSVFSHTDSKLQGSSNDNTSVEHSDKSPKSKVDILILNELEEVKEKSLIQGTQSDSDNKYLSTSDSVEKNCRSWTESREKEPVSDSKLTKTSTTDELQFETLDEKVKKIEDELIENNKRFELPVSKFDLKTKESGHLHQTYMPSEYVHNMNTGDKFDGRKMDLKSKNFDAALSAMLNNEKTNMLTMQADYDKYAHSNLPRRSFQAHSKHRHHRHEHRSKGQEKSRLASTLTSGGVWGPDAKNSPISEKIRKYLHSPEERKFLQEKHKSSLTGTRPRSLEDLSKINQGTRSAPSGFEIEEETPKKITALEDKEREISFMNRAQAERDRVARIRQARQAAEKIQKAWKRYIAMKAQR